MPDFNTFRINQKLVGQSFALRMANPYLERMNINNPKFNKDIKVRTIEFETFDTYEEWFQYILTCSKKNFEENVKTESDDTESKG